MGDKLRPGRPPVKRNAEAFLRDIESLRRLRLSLVQFHLGDGTAQDAIRTIDSLITTLYVLRASA